MSFVGQLRSLANDSYLEANLVKRSPINAVECEKQGFMKLRIL